VSIIAPPCRICSLDTTGQSDLRRKIELDFIDTNDARVGRKWQKAAKLNLKRPANDIKRHRVCVASREPVKPESLSEIKEARHRKELAGEVKAEIKHEKTVAERQNQIYDMAFGLVKIAAKRGDLRAAAGCLGQAVAITGQMKVVDPGTPTQNNTTINISSLSDKELKVLEPILAKLESGSTGTGKTAPN
jgi:hypothetical protein